MYATVCGSNSEQVRESCAQSVGRPAVAGFALMFHLGEDAAAGGSSGRCTCAYFAVSCSLLTLALDFCRLCCRRISQVTLANSLIGMCKVFAYIL